MSPLVFYSVIPKCDSPFIFVDDAIDIITQFATVLTVTAKNVLKI